MGGPGFNWEAPFDGKLWTAELQISNAPSGPLMRPRLRLAIHRTFSQEHHFGIEVWDEPRNIPTIAPIDVFTTMQSVSSLFQARVRLRQMRYHR